LILEHKPHPEQGFRACLGFIRLAKPFGAKRARPFMTAHRHRLHHNPVATIPPAGAPSWQ
jgi:hypothetical protein